MENTRDNGDDLSRIQNARQLIDFFHRLMMHHALWFAEVKQQLGKEKAFKILSEVYQKSYEIQVARLAKTLEFDLIEGMPAPLLDIPDETIKKLNESIAVNWLASDGIWFQSVEFSEDMTTARKCNDQCWAEFSPLEAWSVKRLLDLSELPGLDGLKEALKLRFYAFVNKQSVTDETPHSFAFRMNECRVQAARKRKGLDDYPCKSAGIIEYTTFAETIDPRIRTECIGCPPDRHPEDWHCSWKFSI
ncbi:MAG TPA: DUF6125 family protein [Bacteroidales bacterium]|nr:DUF6125 family protein [Bacteroidales bacterium]